MRKLHEVEEAKALMTEAVAWSVMRWLREKKRVRQVADKANAALDELDRAVKARWSPETLATYEELVRQAGASSKQRSPEAGTHKAATSVMQFAEQVRKADEEAHRARMDAERTFDEAERLLSTSLARTGCEKAIRSWELHEKAIRQAEG